MGFGKASCLSKLACIISIVNVFGLLVGTFTVAWITWETTFTDIGLFQTCVDSICTTLDTSVFTGIEWFEATRGMVVIGFIISLLCVLTIVVYVFVKNETKSLRNLAMVLAFASGISALIGVIVFAASWEKISTSGSALGWSFALTATSSSVYIVVGGLLVLDILSDRGVF